MTTDPYNYVLDSLKTHLTSNVTDPRTGRDASSPFVVIGDIDRDKAVQYPFIKLSHDNTITSMEGSNDQLDATNKAQVMACQVLIDVLCDSGTQKFNSIWRAELARNIASQVLNALIKKTQLQTLKANYDILHVHQIGGGGVLWLPDYSEFQAPLNFNVEFLYIY